MATVADKATLVAVPAHKRIALAAASLRTAQCAVVSEERISVLCGSWVACLMFRRCLIATMDSLFSLGKSGHSSKTGSKAVKLPRRRRAPAPRACYLHQPLCRSSDHHLCLRRLPGKGCILQSSPGFGVCPAPVTGRRLQRPPCQTRVLSPQCGNLRALLKVQSPSLWRAVSTAWKCVGVSAVSLPLCLGGGFILALSLTCQGQANTTWQSGVS